MSTEKKETKAAETKEEKVEEETKAEETKKEKKPKKDSKKEAEIKETAEKLIKEEQEKYLRLAAEYDNFRKRSARERDNIYADVKADTLKKLLPIFDNLERALRQETADEAYKKGVEMTMTQFLEALNALGVTPIEAVGQKFDPNEHNAVMHMEDPDKGEGEIVVHQRHITQNWLAAWMKAKKISRFRSGDRNGHTPARCNGAMAR